MEDDIFDIFNEETSSKPKPSKGKKEEDSNVQSERIKRAHELVKAVASEKRKADDEFDDEEAKRQKFDPLEDLNIEESIPRMQVHTVETQEACTHEVAIPPHMELTPLQRKVSKPAKEYPFTLDPFQREALLCLENCESVLVSAHTSAGKTVVAEYAIAMSLRDKQRVIYTTPIKALSNQKYREFSEQFSTEAVGLMTGDVTINPTASCLIMTTEILRSMLYRGSEVTREVAWVIFDEIHYMRDKERGVVWEETIILLSDNVHFVFLSATIPNARQFAEWICHLHKQPCHVVYTDYRPVPLQHYIYPCGGDGLHLVVDENGDFREENFNAAMTVISNAGDNAKREAPGRKGGQKGGEPHCYKIVKMIMERNLAPVIVFSFSKKDCENYALQMSKLDFNTPEEKDLVVEVFNNAMNVLSDEDKELPQVKQSLPLLKRGIGIHHSGLLPILKETIEILFSEGLLKALFATETFSMGLNMPARTVLFTNARKFDGNGYRWISSGEYIQMSGRAGRRGLDERGIVILMVDESMSPDVGKDLIKGKADALRSAFHLTYNMVLNLLRVEGINPEYMLERSFFQFQNYAVIPEIYEKLKKLKEDHDKISIKSESEVASYYNIRQQLDTLSKEFHTFLTDPKYLVPFLQPGRLVSVKNKDDEFGWGVVINFYRKTVPGKELEPDTPYIVEALLHVASKSKTVGASVKPPAPGDTGDMQVVPIMLHLIQKVSSVRVYYPEDLKPQANRMKVLKTIQQMAKQFPNDFPKLDPVEDMRITVKEFKDIVRKIGAFEKRMFEHPLHESHEREELYNLYVKKAQIQSDIALERQELKKAKSLLQLDELKCRKRVLRRLGYCTQADVIEKKGRVACEISCADELVVTELLFSGAFNDLAVPQIVSLLSCLVFEERANEMPKLTDELSGALRLMQDTARRIAKISKECKLELNEDNYVDSFKPFLMDVVYAWCNGVSFFNICAMTNVFEGSIIRCLRRLEEFLRQMCQAAKGIGNVDLELKFTDGIARIKRDIAFAASLYL